jgi:hypothetical protein
VANESRLGYFGTLYKRITVSIKKNLPNFQDPARMERLDVTFASRYFAALNAWFWPAQFPPLGHAWRVAFQAAALPQPILVQHMLAGVNAHIDLDLGIAAAEVSPGTALTALESDFTLVNKVLAQEVAGVLDEIDELSPTLAAIYDLFASLETRVVDDVLDVSRAAAWSFATELALLDRGAWPASIARRDAEVAEAGTRILAPPETVARLLEAVALLETRDVVRIIETLDIQAEAANAT